MDATLTLDGAWQGAARQRRSTRLAFLLAGIAMAAWAPLVPFAKARLGVDDGTLGLLLLCLGLGSIAAMPVTGVLATRFGCRVVIATGGVLACLALPLLALAGSVPLLALSLVLFGASVGTVDVTMNIQAVLVEKSGGRALMSGFHGLFSLGGILGAGGVSLLLGLGASPLVCMLVVAALGLGLLLAAYPDLLPHGGEEGRDGPWLVLPRGLVILIGGLCFVVFLGEGAVLDWSAVFLANQRGVDPAQAGLGYAAFALAMTAGRLGGDRIVQALGGQRVLALGGLLTALGFAIVVLAPWSAAAYLGFLLVGIGASNLVPVLFSAAARQGSMPAGLAISAISTMGYVGILAGPALIGFAAGLVGLGTAFVGLALALAGVAASYRIAAR